MEEHFYFAGDNGSEFYPSRFCDLAVYGYDYFSCEDDDRCRPSEDVHGHWCDVNIWKLGSACYGETDECAAYQEFVGEWVGYASEFAGDVEFAGYVAVDDVGQAGDDE